MSRHNHRRSLNAASLIQPSALVRICIECGVAGFRAYDLEGNYVADYCREHLRKNGYCGVCGNQLTEAERQAQQNPCPACVTVRNDIWNEIGDESGDF